MKYTAPPRPWALEVQEPDIIDGSLSWQVWSTYRDEANATKRQVALADKGYQARVVYTGTDDGPCPHCGDTHPEPHDGGCLL